MKIASVIVDPVRDLYRCVLCNEVLFKADLRNIRNPKDELAKFVDRHNKRCLTQLPEDPDDD